MRIPMKIGSRRASQRKERKTTTGGGYERPGRSQV
jgi:hypothetical protein